MRIKQKEKREYVKNYTAPEFGRWDNLIKQMQKDNPEAKKKRRKAQHVK